MKGIMLDRSTESQINAAGRINRVPNFDSATRTKRVRRRGVGGTDT